MITSSVTPGISTQSPSWAGCKEKLFLELVQKTEKKMTYITNKSPQYNVAEFGEILEIINLWEKKCGQKLFKEEYVVNMFSHFSNYKGNQAYIHELIEDFKFKAVKKLAKIENLSFPIVDPSNLSIRAQGIFLNIMDQTQELSKRSIRNLEQQVESTNCVGLVDDIVYDNLTEVHTMDRCGQDFSKKELGHRLKLKDKPAPIALPSIEPLGPNTMTAVISKNKFIRLLTERSILVIARNNTTGLRSVCKAGLPTYLFSDIVESKHLYRGMENYPPVIIYSRKGSHLTVWYSFFGGHAAKVAL